MTDLRKAAEMALEALEISTPVYSPHKFTQALKALEAALAQPEQEHIECGYDETVGMCTNNPCCEQTPIAHLWECIGRWSAYLASNGEKANLAPPEWLVDAVKAATAPQRKPWVGLTEREIELVLINSGYTAQNFARVIEARLKELNT